MLSLFAAGALGFWWAAGPAGGPEPPVPCTCRQLVDDPGAYDGRRVRLALGGLQSGATRRELVYRQTARGPVLVVLRFTHPLPANGGRPPYAVGTVRAGRPVLVADCVPDRGP